MLFLCRLQRLKDVVKSTEQVNESVQSFSQWLVDADEHLLSHVVYQSAGTEEIQRHLMDQEVTAAAAAAAAADSCTHLEL